MILLLRKLTKLVMGFHDHFWRTSLVYGGGQSLGVGSSVSLRFASSISEDNGCVLICRQPAHTRTYVHARWDIHLHVHQRRGRGRRRGAGVPRRAPASYIGVMHDPPVTTAAPPLEEMSPLPNHSLGAPLRKLRLSCRQPTNH